ncbi:MAG: CaiB/BaiF CoA-transferase family protein [Thermodesulfobacteriota bacterium]|nr:CaiB/BaiF CoA-transferase family protein [Thermodesulfobacteriota bacterium]
MNPLLSQLKVLDFTTLLPGPFATMMLADLGAEVVRIESPTRFDLLRLIPPYVDGQGTISYGHAYLNRNKKSMALDLKNKDSFSVVERLIQQYDVIVEQFRPGVMDRLGLSYERLSASNPKLIYCSITGYGQSGSWKFRAGHDINYLSLSGIMSYSGRKETGPNLMGIQIADVGAGSYNALVSILAAVINRMESGEGQYIDVSMTDGLFPYQAMSSVMELSGQGSIGYETEMLNGGSLYDFYETSDGKYISFGGIEPQFFNNFCTVLGLDDLKSGGIDQVGNLEEAKKRVSDIIRSKPRDYWVEKFQKEDACVEPVLSFKEAVDSDQAKERGVLVDIPAPDGKDITQIAYPVKFSNFTPEYKRCGCKLGEDTMEIMESLGYDRAEIEKIKEKGVFGDK